MIMRNIQVGMTLILARQLVFVDVSALGHVFVSNHAKSGEVARRKL